VTVKREKSMLFAINKPDVFKAAGSETYIVFGEAKPEDPSQSVASEAAKKFKKEEATTESAAAAPTEAAAAKEEEPEDDTEVSAEGLEEKDIELVIAQANVSRAKAIKALKSANGDIVNTIMNLTTA